MPSTNRKKDNAVRNNMIWALISVAISYGISFFVTPYVTNNIGVDAYGYVSLSNTFIAYIDIIAIGLNSFAGRFIADAYFKGDLEKAEQYYSSTLMGDLLLSAVVSIPCLFAVSKLDVWLHVPSSLCGDVKILFTLVLFRYFLTIIRTAFAAGAFIKNRLDLTEKITGSGYIVQAGILLLLCTTPKAKVWYVGVASFSAAAWLLICSYIAKKRLTPDLICTRKGASIKTLREIMKPGIWTSVNELGNVLNSGLDLILTEAMLSPEVLGQVAIAKQFSTACSIMIGKVSSSYRPQLLMHYTSDDMESVRHTMIRSMKFCSFCCTMIISIFTACGKQFLQLWIPGQDLDFIYAASVIAILSDVLPGIVNPLYYSYTMAKKVTVPCFVTLSMGAANLISMVILLKTTSLGGYVVLLTTLVINMVHFIDAPLYSAHCLRLKWHTFYPNIIRCLTACGLGFMISFLLRDACSSSCSWLLLILKGIITACAVAGTGYLVLYKDVRSPFSILRTLRERK